MCCFTGLKTWVVIMPVFRKGLQNRSARKHLCHLHPSPCHIVPVGTAKQSFTFLSQCPEILLFSDVLAEGDLPAIIEFLFHRNLCRMSLMIS